MNTRVYEMMKKLLEKEMMPWGILVYLSILLFVLGEQFHNLDNLLKALIENPFQSIAALIGGVASIVILFKSTWKFTKNEFVTVDQDVYGNNKVKIKQGGNVIVRNSNPKLANQQGDKTVNNDTETPHSESPDISKVIDFEQYCIQIVGIFQTKAESADRKASILLGRGVALSAFGIIFYILSIIIWQWRAHSGGLKSEIILGVISTSFLFLFIEFLSAWFLKQYRHFIDTSTYMIKAKSIFDKYMLLNLFAKDMEKATKIDDISEIVKILGEEIKWPDITKYSREDVSFAKEAMETATLLLNSAKGLVKNDTGKGA